MIKPVVSLVQYEDVGIENGGWGEIVMKIRVEK